MENEMFQFMVEFTMPPVLNEKFTSTIPAQRSKINQMFNSGKVVSYAVSLENAKVWAVFNAETEGEANELARELPLTKYMSYKVNTLTFMNILTARVPSFSVN
jgi:muconolactone delta-isomerase